MAWLREADAEFQKAVAASPGLRDLANWDSCSSTSCGPTARCGDASVECAPCIDRRAAPGGRAGGAREALRRRVRVEGCGCRQARTKSSCRVRAARATVSSRVRRGARARGQQAADRIRDADAMLVALEHSEAAIRPLQELGHSPRAARGALRRAEGNSIRAANELTERAGRLAGEPRAPGGHGGRGRRRRLLDRRGVAESRAPRRQARVGVGARWTRSEMMRTRHRGTTRTLQVARTHGATHRWTRRPLASLVSMGAEAGAAEDALRATGGNIDAAAAKLLEAPPPQPDNRNNRRRRPTCPPTTRTARRRSSGARAGRGNWAARWRARTPTRKRGATCSSSGACSTRSSAGHLRHQHSHFSRRPAAGPAAAAAEGFVQKPVANTDWPFFFFPRRPSSNRRSVSDDPDS